MATITLTADFQTVEGGWTQARLVDVPGVITCAPTREQAREDLIDALEQFLRSHTVGTPDLAAAPDRERVELRLVLAD